MRLARCATRAPQVALGAVLAAVGGHARAEGAPTGLQTEVLFTDYTPQSQNSELVRRLLSPLAAAQMQQALVRSGEQLREQSIELSTERFVLYVPRVAPPHGYGLLVFVPPWQDARLPVGWAPIFDRYGLIFVSSARSGNEENVIGRRVPLALLAAYNVMRRYPVDPDHIYVGGFSGGSRVALRLALGFPDLFNGALLNAGSDPLGSEGLLPPPVELLRRFQESTRLIYVTGERDTTALAMDGASERSMREWCVFDVSSQSVPQAAHQAATPAALEHALLALLAHRAPDPSRLAACRADLDRSRDAELRKVAALIDGGRRAEARKLLLEIDRRFGGLAAPRILELQAALEGGGTR